VGIVPCVGGQLTNKDSLAVVHKIDAFTLKGKIEELKEARGFETQGNFASCFKVIEIVFQLRVPACKNQTNS